MIVIKAEDGSIITDTKEISVGQDLEGDYYVIEDLSDSNRVKPINLTALPHDKEALSQVVDDMYYYIEGKDGARTVPERMPRDGPNRQTEV